MGPPLAAEQLHRRASTASKSPADSTDAGSLQRRAASGERRAVSRTRPAVFWPSNYLAGGRLRQTLRTPLPSARAPPVAACRAAVLGAAKPVIEERLTEVRGSTVRAKPKCRFEPECAGSDKAVVSTQGCDEWRTASSAADHRRDGMYRRSPGRGTSENQVKIPQLETTLAVRRLPPVTAPPPPPPAGPVSAPSASAQGHRHERLGDATGAQPVRDASPASRA